MTDAHTERLFHVEGASRIVFSVSRLLVDPERFADDGKEQMAERGMGVIYTTTANGEVLSRDTDLARLFVLLDGMVSRGLGRAKGSDVGSAFAAPAARGGR